MVRRSSLTAPLPDALLSTVTIQEAFTQALQHHQAGRLMDAEGLYRQILAAQPDHAEAMHYLGVIAYQVGRCDLAIEWIRQALVFHPDNPAAHSNLGEAYRKMGRIDEAIASFNRALQLKPDYADAVFNLGNALKDCGQLDEALAAYRRGLEIKPDYAGGHNNLGNAFKEQGDLDKALAAYRQALHFNPNLPEAHNNLGTALAAQERFDEAIAAYRRALQCRPDYPEAHNNLGTALAECGRFDEAVAACTRALELKPDYAEAHYNLGTAQRARGRLDEAVLAFRRALQFRPDLPDVHNNLGLTLSEQGQFDEALVAYRRALELKPDQAGVHSNLVYTLHFHPAQDERMIAEEQQRWNQRFSAPLKPVIAPHAIDPNPACRLKIGYVSPDFHSHAVSFFLVPLLEHHDREQYEIYCYAGGRLSDAVTERLRNSADVWREVRALSDAQFAERVRADGIDILVDLAMHTAGNRLPAFARRPAPVQVSWLAYPGSTGMDAIDYRLTDAQIDPVDQDDPGPGGQAVRLPDSWCCYAPIAEFPPVGPLPAAQKGTVTFGSLNQFRKIHDGVLHCWAGILAAVPGSRLLMVCPEGPTRDRTRALFAKHGIAPERVEFVATCPWPDYTRLFERIDIALDSYPCNGMTTTCHALWMGVPVVTRTGTSAISRAGASLLHTVGLSEWVAQNEEEYLRIATRWANDLPHLAELRKTLRSRMQASPSMDAPRFARHVEAAYRTMWQKWCKVSPAQNAPQPTS